MHSSKLIAISLSNLFWISIDFSGVKSKASPLYWFLNLTPSSVISFLLAKLNTWNPPESVKIGPFQFINLCNPPAWSITVSPGLSHKW